MPEPVAGIARTIDLNADVGESFGRWQLGDDMALIPLITSANVACGFHAGDPLTLRRTVAAAAGAGVTVGAQVGYRDLVGFGRRFLDIDPGELLAETIYQIGALDGLCRAEGIRVRYVKPHGALYNAIVRHREQAIAVAEAVRLYDPTLPVLGLPASAFLAAAAEKGLTAVPEAFADRRYRADGSLVPRKNPGAVLTEPGAVVRQVISLVTTGTVISEAGTTVPIPAQSLCVHGDTDGAVAIAAAVRKALDAAGLSVRSFVAEAGR